ncbi:Pre-mRNA-splicing factor cwf16 [Pyricularia oryzae]
MSERKVLTKYYPADFDPSALTRRRRGPKQQGPKVQTVRLMAPFSMKCTTCGEYIYRGRKFNARKETPEEKYLGIQIYRFYIKCTRCSGEIRFRTDPANQDYVCETGAHRNTDPWKRGAGDAVAPEETDEERLDRLEHEEEERNAMVELEAKTVDAKREMAVADALDEIRTRNARIARADRDGIEVVVAQAVDEEREKQEREDEEAARRAFAFARSQVALEEEIMDEDDDSAVGGAAAGTNGPAASSTAGPSAAAAATSVGDSEMKPPAAMKSTSTDMPPPPVPTSFKRQVKKKTDRAALLGIKKKT